MQKIHLDIKPGQKLFFTSDLHIGHRNVLRFCHRPFENEKAMAEEFIKRWNSVVSEDDIVFDLGDMFWFDGRHEVKKFITKLNGTIYKLPGNHDMDITQLFELCPEGKVNICNDIVTLFVSGICKEKMQKNYEMVLCHYPLATFPHFENNRAIQLFGHIHSGPLTENMVDIPGQDLILTKKQYDVGVDNNDYTPIEIRDIYKKLEVIL